MFFQTFSALDSYQAKLHIRAPMFVRLNGNHLLFWSDLLVKFELSEEMRD